MFYISDGQPAARMPPVACVCSLSGMHKVIIYMQTARNLTFPGHIFFHLCFLPCNIVADLGRHTLHM